MKRREAIKMMGVGAVAATSLDGETLQKLPEGSVRSTWVYHFYPIDDQYGWVITEKQTNSKLLCSVVSYNSETKNIKSEIFLKINGKFQHYCNVRDDIFVDYLDMSLLCRMMVRAECTEGVSLSIETKKSYAKKVRIDRGTT